MKYNSYFLFSVLIYFAGFSSQVTRAQNYTRPNIIHCNCTSVTVSSKIFPSTALPWGFDWRINDGTDTSVLVSVTIRREKNPFIITPGPKSSYSERYNISNFPEQMNSTSTPFISTVTITGPRKDKNLTLSVPGLESSPLICECSLKNASMYDALNITCEKDPCTEGSKAKLICLNSTVIEVVCGCDELFNGTCNIRNECSVENASLYDAMNITCEEDPCTEGSKAKLICQNSIAIDVVCGGDGSFNGTCTRNTECSVENASLYDALNITCEEDPCTEGSKAKLICQNSIAIDVLCGSNGSFNGTCTRNTECSVENVSLYNALNITCEEDPCTEGSKAKLICQDSKAIDVVCGGDELFNGTCTRNTGKTISDGGIIGITIVCVAVALSAVAIWVVIKNKSRGAIED